MVQAPFVLSSRLWALWLGAPSAGPGLGRGAGNHCRRHGGALADQDPRASQAIVFVGANYVNIMDSRAILRMDMGF